MHRPTWWNPGSSSSAARPAPTAPLPSSWTAPPPPRTACPTTSTTTRSSTSSASSSTATPKIASYWCPRTDRKSTRLNSSHVRISYAVFCLKKKKQKNGVEDPYVAIEHVDGVVQRFDVQTEDHVVVPVFTLRGAIVM